MTTPLYKQYENADPIGVHVLSNWGGLVILDINDADGIAVAAFNWGTGHQKIRRHQIHSTYTGRAYIRKNGTRFYFDQIMRTNGGY